MFSCKPAQLCKMRKTSASEELSLMYKRLYPSWYKKNKGGNDKVRVTVWFEAKNDLTLRSRNHWHRVKITWLLRDHGITYYYWTIALQKNEAAKKTQFGLLVLAISKWSLYYWQKQ